MVMSLLEQVVGLGDLVRADADEIERERRISGDVVAALRATGLNRAMVPRALGGDDRPVLEVIDAVEHLAAMDGSTGWCAAVGAGSNLFSGYLAHDVAKEIWSDPDQGNASMFGPFGQVRPAGGSLTLSGRWPFSSNCLHSDHIGLGSLWFTQGEEPEPIPRLVFVPMADVEVDPTWTSPGLCGTGSHHTVVADLPVDRSRSLTFVDQAFAEGPVWRMPLFTVLGPTLGVTALGMARGAVEDVRALIAGRAGSTRGSIADDPIALADFAMADTRLRAARGALTDAVGAAWSAAERGDPVTKPMQARVTLAVGYGADIAVEVASTCHRLGGGAAAYAGSSLLRRLRDVETARQHVMFGHGSRPLLARALAGEDIFAPPFIV
jgi:alkylation response protein AidB-like acyl-CoA dehydrogenase